MPLQTTFRNMAHSEAVERSIGKHLQSLGRFRDWIVGCRVVVEARDQSQQGTLFHVRIGLTVPGGGIVVGREPVAHRAHEDVFSALQEAFDAARRQLEEFERRHSLQVEARDILEQGGKDRGPARPPWWRGASK